MRFLLAFLLLLSGWAGAAQAFDSGARPLRVFVSVLPQKTFVERLGGERVQVEVMVRPGDSPHTYEPTPRQVAALADADLYVAVGGTFEDAWMGRIRSANPHMAIVNTGEGLDLRAMQAHDHDRDEEVAPEGGRHQSKDPHLWTSPTLVGQMAARIRDALLALDPAQGPFYAANYASFTAELEDLDRDIRAQLAGLSDRRFMVFHPSWGYFADTYGLIQVPIEHEGKEPGPKALVALIEQARREQVKVIFVQPQFSRKAAAQVAAAIDGRVEVMDPLAPDYSANLRRVAAVLAGAGSR